MSSRPTSSFHVGVAHQQGLRIGIDRDELDALETDLDHPVDGVHKNSVYVDEKIGSAATLDCAILEAYYGGSLAFLHAAAMCKAEGLDPKTFFSHKNSFLGLISVTADAAQGMIERNDFSGDQCSLNTHVAAIEHIVRLSKDARISARFPKELLENYKRALSEGMGNQELPAVFRTLMQD